MGLHERRVSIRFSAGGQLVFRGGGAKRFELNFLIQKTLSRWPNQAGKFILIASQCHLTDPTKHLVISY